MANTKVTQELIADDAIGAAQLASNAVVTASIADDAVTSAKLDTNLSVAGSLTAVGTLTANAGINVDNINIDGTTIGLSTGDLTLDVAGDITFDADGGDFVFKDGGSGDEANKVIRFSTPSHDTDEENTQIFQVECEASTNQITIGGGTAALNAATDILFKTAAIDTTTGVSRLEIDASGNVVFNQTGIDADFRVESNINVNSLFVSGETGNVGIGGVPVASDTGYDTATLHLHQTQGSNHGSQIHLTNATTGAAAGNGMFISMWSDDDVYFTNQESDGNIIFASGGNSNALVISDSGVVTSKTSANISQVAITSSSNAVAWDSRAAANAYHVTTENTTFSAPSNSVEGAIISVELAQGGTVRTIAWNTVFEFAASTAPTVTATANKTDIFSFRYNGSVWQEIGRVQNLAQT